MVKNSRIQIQIKVFALLPTLTDTVAVRWVLPMTPKRVAKVLIDGLRWGTPAVELRKNKN